MNTAVVEWILVGTAIVLVVKFLVPSVMQSLGMLVFGKKLTHSPVLIRDSPDSRPDKARVRDLFGTLHPDRELLGVRWRNSDDNVEELTVRYRTKHDPVSREASWRFTRRDGEWSLRR